MMTRIQHRFTDATRGEGGVTLAEMSVTTLILGMLLASVTGMVVSAMRIDQGVQERLNQSNSVTVAMQRLSRNLRTAVLQSQLTSACVTSACTDSAFLLAGPTSVQFYADVDNPGNTIGPSRVTYTVASGALTETVQKPDSAVPDATGYHYCTAGSNGCVIRTTVLATGVQSSTAVFAYYTSADPVNAMAMSTGNVLSAAQLKTVDSVDVNLQVIQSGGQPVGGATMVERVALPNSDSVVRTTGS